MAVAATVLVGLSLRLIGAGWGAPYGYHYDEPFIMKPALQIVASGDPNPHFFNYPSAMIYAETAIVAAHHRFGRMDLLVPRGPGYGPVDLGEWTWPALLDGRRLVAVLGALGVLASAWLAFTTAGAAAAVVAAAVLATVPLHVEHGHYLTTDVPMATWTTLALAVAAGRATRAWRYVLAGALLGLAVATKYTAAFALPALLAVIALASRGSHRAVIRNVALAALAVGLAFAVVCPFVWLDWSSFTADLAVVRSHYAGGHLGAEGSANWGWYLRRLHQTGSGTSGIALLAGGCLAAALSPLMGRHAGSDGEATGEADDDRRRADLVALVVTLLALAWFAWLGSVTVRFERNLLPAIALAAAACGHGVARTASRLGRTSPAAAVATYAVVVAALLTPAYGSVQTARRFAGTDTRAAALAWIDANVRPGSAIAREEFTPRPDPQRYGMSYMWSLGSHEPQWFEARGIDYLIASHLVWGRILGDPQQRDPAAVRRYRQLFAGERVATFAADENMTGPMISIYGLRPEADDRDAGR